MSVSGLTMSPVGSLLLFTMDPSAIAKVIGVVFFLFSVWKLSSTVWSVAGQVSAETHAARSKHPDFVVALAPFNHPEEPARLGPESSRAADALVAAQSAHAAPLSLDEPANPTAPAAILVSPAAASPVMSPGGTSSDDVALVSPSSKATPEVESVNPNELIPVPGGVRTPWKMWGIIFMGGLFGGLLSGLLGVGGPPMMIAYNIVRLHKDDMRASSAPYSVAEMIVRLSLFAARYEDISTSGSASQGRWRACCTSQFVLRPFSHRSGADVVQSERWPLYVLIMVSAATAYSLGSYLRRYTDTETVMRLLLVLVFVAGCLQLGALSVHAHLFCTTASLRARHSTDLLVPCVPRRNPARWTGRRCAGFCVKPVVGRVARDVEVEDLSATRRVVVLSSSAPVVQDQTSVGANNGVNVKRIERRPWGLPCLS